MKEQLKYDLTDSSSLLFYSLEELDRQANEWQNKADRIKELNRILVYKIQNNYITDMKIVDSAIAWFNHHPELSPEECVKLAMM
jgi:hypothetical protein